MKLAELVKQAGDAGLQPVVLPAVGGDGAVVVTVHGARILGVFTGKDAENLFFVNPELADAGQAKQMLAGEHVLGGDRLWLAPERGIFFKGNTAEDGNTTPPSLDPGSYVVGRKSVGAIRLLNEIKTPFWHSAGQKDFHATVERTIRSIASPFASFPKTLPELSRVKFAGYEIASRFELLGAPEDKLAFGMWFLIQMVVPQGGHLYVPTSGKTTVTDYYEPTGSDYLRVEESHVRFKLDSINRHKIGVRKTEVTGRVGFLSNADAGGNATLIVRNFLNNPSADYCDVPLDKPDGTTQDSVQSYNHFTGPGGFGELEYHSPATTRGADDPVVCDTNQVWCFNGKRGDLVVIAAQLLNLPASVFGL